MRKGLLLGIVLILLLSLSMGTIYGASDSPTLILDGQVLQTPEPPVIRSGRTLLPAKVLFESMGGTVSWDAQLRKTTIALDDTTVELFIDSTTAYVNGEEKQLDVPATIISRRTYVPVNFVATQLGCEVLWNATDRTVTVNSPKEPVQVTDISVQQAGDTLRVQLSADSAIEGYRSVAYELPDRVVIDIKHAKLNFEDTDAAGSLGISNSVFSDVRYSQFDTDTVRAVIDLAVKQAPHVSLSQDKMSVYVDFTVDENSGDSSDDDNSDNDDGDNTSGEVLPDNGDGVINNPQLADLDLPQLDWRMQGQLIVIDPGHGGTDSGSLGYQNGSVILQEKTINLKVATRLNELLQMAGATTHMTRTDDSSVALYDRPEIANQLSAALFVSCHNNSNESATPHGTEVHYSNKESEADYNFRSQTVATFVMDELEKSMGLQRRGAKLSPSYAVIRCSNMPAIIIEGAFLSNPSDLQYMLTDQYVEDYALGAARGIIKALNASVN